MARLRRPATAATLALVAVLTGCSSDTQQLDPSVVNLQAGAPGEPNVVLTEIPDDVRLGSPFSVEDVSFLADMQVHHAQALEMVALVAERGGREDLTSFAQRMQISQEAEVDLIDSLLAEHDEIVVRQGLASHDEGGHTGHTADGDASDMPGMLTEAQLDALAAASGEEFVRLWIDSMTAHHLGALSMVSDLVSDGSRPVEPRVYSLAAEVESDQGIELDRMSRIMATLPS